MAKRSTPRTTGLDKLALEKLASSGLTAADAELLHIESLTAEQTQAEHPSLKALPSLKFNYIDPRTGKPQTFAPAWPPFIRYRYLKMEPSFGDKKPQRYANAPGIGVCAYFPTNWPTWKEDIKNPKVPVLITEGELKAACACKHGYPTIGLGGTDNFQSSKSDITFLDELDAINWVQRRVYIVFDSDFRVKPGVVLAANKLAEKLYMRGAIVFFVSLPEEIPGGKTGLDDFLVNATGIEPLTDLIKNAQSLTIVRGLFKLNEEVVHIEKPTMFVMREDGTRMSKGDFQVNFADRTTPERKLSAAGNPTVIDVPIADRWIEWRCHERVGGIDYDPSHAPLSIIANGTVRGGVWNTWEGFAVEAKRDDKKAQLFVDLLNHLFAGAPAADLKWFTQWLAYPIQHPGAKLYTAATICGTMHGSGKSFIGIVMGDVYGKNYKTINQKQLEGSFTDWAENRQFVMIDDITGKDKRDLADDIKFMITRPTVDINIKFLPAYQIVDHINFYITSNQVANAIYLEDTDRRFFIHQTMAGVLPLSIREPLDAAHKDGTLGPAVRYWLEHVDLKGFDPNAAALSTSSKELMSSQVRSDLGEFLYQIKMNPGDTLRVKEGGGWATIPGDLFTSAELLGFFKLWMHYNNGTVHPKITATTVSQEAQRLGIRFANGGKYVRSRGANAKYLIARNEEKWLNAPHAALAKHIESVCHPNDNTWLKGQSPRGKS